MKREINKYYVSAHFPLLIWKKCFFCEKEFVREHGYKFIVSNSIFSYTCSDCCCSVSHCHDKIEHFFESRRAKMLKSIPPSPPMRTYRKHV